MKRVILDHFRRRAWVFALGAVIQIALGFGQSAAVAAGHDDALGSLQFQLGVFMGAFLLSLDLQRGIARTLGTLPLSTARLGRAWWLACVAIPAAALASLLVLGAAIFHCVHPDKAIPLYPLAGSALSLLLTLGAGFTLVFKATQGFGAGQGWQRVLGVASGILWGLLIGGGMLIVQNLHAHPPALILCVAIGAALTVIGWFQAGTFASSRAAFRPASENKQNATARSSAVRRSSGLSGLPLLMGQTCSRAFLAGLAMIVLPPMMFRLQGHPLSWTEAVRQMTGTSYPTFWFLLLFTLTPVLMQLRHLRTLPLSGGGLAATLLAMLLLPMLTLGVLTTTLGGLVLGAPVALTVAHGQLISIVPAVLIIAFMAWRGQGRAVYFSVILLVMGAQFGAIWLRLGRNVPSISLPVTAALVATAITAAFFLTRLALERGSHAYRAPAAGPFARAWGAGR